MMYWINMITFWVMNGFMSLFFGFAIMILTYSPTAGVIATGVYAATCIPDHFVVRSKLLKTGDEK